MRHSHTYSNKLVFFSVLFAVIFTSQSYAQGTWVPITNPAPFRSGGGMFLLSDGTVIAKNTHGGTDGYGNSWSRLTPDIHGSYINGTWDTTAPMFETRLYFASQMLKDGRVYVAGGEYGSGGPNVEIYDAGANTWTPAPALTGGDGMADASSEILPDGRVLQAYFISPAGIGCKIFDPASNIYYPGPPTLDSWTETTWLKLPDGSILFANHDRSSERYIPSLNIWVADDSMPYSLYGPFDNETGPAFMLPDGRAFFTGSPGTTAYYTPSGTAAPGSWAAGPSFPDEQGVPDAPGAMMANGKILIATSFYPYGPGIYPAPTSFYEFNYLTDSFTLLSAPIGGYTVSDACFNSTMLDLPDGSVLYVNQESTVYYDYVPDGAPIAAGKPTIDSIIKVSCDTYKVTGKGFNGITEGAGYGDDWQMSSNYPLVRLKSGANVYYARSFNWNSTGVMRGTLPDTTEFTLPAGLPAGTFNLEVVANGNPSDPHLFIPCMLSLEIGQNNNGKGDIYAYPNPATGSVSLVFNSKAGGKYNITLLDVLGRTAISESGDAITGQNTHLLNLEGIAKGVYTLLLQQGTGVYNTKIVVE